MSKILYTSLEEIRSFKPCSAGWKAVLEGQGKTEADSVLFPLKDCLKSNTFSDVCWLLGKRRFEIELAVRAAKRCAESVGHLRGAAENATAATAAATAAIADDAAARAAARAAAYAATAVDAADAEDQVELNKQYLLEEIEAFEAMSV